MVYPGWCSMCTKELFCCCCLEYATGVSSVESVDSTLQNFCIHVDFCLSSSTPYYEWSIEAAIIILELHISPFNSVIFVSYISEVSCWVCQVSSVQLLSRVRLFVTPWTAARQASLSIPNSQSLLKLMSIELVTPSNHHILCPPLLSPSIFPNIRVFSNESALHIRWPKYWSFSFNISPPVNIQDWFPLGWIGQILLLSKGLWRVFSNTTVQKHQFLGVQLSS